jgi:hypothetical protein
MSKTNRKTASSSIEGKMTPYAELEHHLITIGGLHADMHAYVITDQMDEFKTTIYNRMADEAEKFQSNFPLPIVLHTGPLDMTGQELIWKVYEKYNPEAKASVDKTKAGEKNFHLSMWIMPNSWDFSEELMKLH